eukprot:scaffold6186_cov21-Prasinocladus_malaysianus.AAC.4
MRANLFRKTYQLNNEDEYIYDMLILAMHCADLPAFDLLVNRRTRAVKVSSQAALHIAVRRQRYE